MQERLYKPQEIAKELGVAVSTVYNWKCAGELVEGLHFFKRNGKGAARYDRAAMLDFMRQGPSIQAAPILRRVK